MWQEIGKGKPHFLCIIEMCQNCEDHAMTTKHDPKMYQSYKNMVAQWVSQEFPFIRCEQLRANSQFVTGSSDSQTRRIGSFEVYLLCPASGDGVKMSPSSGGQLLLLHSKLMTRRWPVWDALRPRLQSALPAIVGRIQNLDMSTQWTPAEAEPLVDEARQWGLDSWDRLEDLVSRVDAARSCLRRGDAAFASGDLEALRQAVQQGVALQLTDDAVAEWRETLKSKNLMVFNLKSQARRWHRNVEMSVAVRLLKACFAPPIKRATLQKAVEKAKAAEMAAEDYEKAAVLLSQAIGVLDRLEASLKSCDLDGVARGLLESSSMQLQDSIIEQGRKTVSHLASGLRAAMALYDLPQLTSELATWRLPADPSKDAWSSQDFVEILAAEQERKRLQGLVDEAEKRYAAKRWEALQSMVGRLSEVKVADETWTRWTSALKREKNFCIMKAVSGAGVELKRRLNAARLEVALRSKSIPIDQLEVAAGNAEKHRVDQSAVERARAEVAAVRQRVAQAENAIAQCRVDVAEVMLWKLGKGRVCVDLTSMREGPLFDMADDVHVADAAGDLEAMQKAIEGWVEDRPGAEHEAFTLEGSPTQAYRFAQKRIRELRLVDLREQVAAALDALGEHASAPAGEVKAELRHVTQLVREMMGLGWELTPPKRARLLALHAVLRSAAKAGSTASAARFSSALFRLLGGPARVVFVLDQSKQVTCATFAQHIKPAAIAVAQHLSKHTQGALWGAVAHGPVKKVQELTADLEAFTGALTNFPFGGGSAPTAKGLRKAMELLRGCVPDAEAERDPIRIVFNLAVREADSVKDAHKAWKLLDAHGVAVIGVAIGPGLSERAIKEFSSPGLAFGVESAAQLCTFVEEAFVGIDKVLSAAEMLSPEETLQELDKFGRE